MSETTNLKLKKHDNPETNTEKFDIENYLNGNWDKIDKNVGEVNTNISNINSKNKEQDTNIGQLQENTKTSSNKIAELEKELKEAQEDFYQASVRGQANGEYIHVEDSSNCRSIIGIGGNHEQETRSGKNLSKIEKISTINGGYINSTCGILATIEAGKTYTISFNCSNKHSGTNAIYVRVLNENTYEGQAALNYSSGNRISKTFVASKSGELSLSASLGTDFEDILYDIQLEEGSTATKYEQYGASPSPDYTSPVVAVGSNVNEFDIDTVKDGFLNEKTGEIISNNSWKCSDFIEILNKTYTFGWESSSDYFQVTVCYYDENKKFISGKSYGLRGTFNNTFEVVSNAKYMKIAYSVSVRGELVTREKIKLEKGKVATPYSKYGQGCVKVTKCNKNLAIKNVKGYFSMSDFKIKIDNNSESFLFYAEKGKEYTRSCKVNLDRNRIGKIDTLDVTQGMTVLNGQEINSKKFICDDSGIYIWFVNSTLNDSIKESFQIEESSTESSFEQHEEKSYIMPVQQEMLVNDYLDYDNEEEVHVWKKLVFDGITNRVANRGESNSKTWARFNGNDWDKKSDWVDYENMKCTHFIVNNSWGKGTTYAKFGNNGIMVQFVFDDNNLKTIEDVNNWLKSQYDAGTPVIVYYKQQTPTRLPFTDEQKVVAKELNNARTYKNVTNITTDSKAILSLDYAKDLETLLTSKESEV